MIGKILIKRNIFLICIILLSFCTIDGPGINDSRVYTFYSVDGIEINTSIYDALSVFANISDSIQVSSNGFIVVTNYFISLFIKTSNKRIVLIEKKSSDEYTNIFNFYKNQLNDPVIEMPLFSLWSNTDNQIKIIGDGSATIITAWKN